MGKQRRPSSSALTALDDTGRLNRLLGATDAVRKMSLYYHSGQWWKIKCAMSKQELVWLGGDPRALRSKAKYSLYRQIVWAHRDMEQYTRRNTFPSSYVTRRSASVYQFYESDGEDVEERRVSVSKKEQHALSRVLVVLKKYRTFAHTIHTLHDDRYDTTAAQDVFRAIVLTPDEYVACGGNKRFKEKRETLEASFRVVVVLAIRDLRAIVNRARFPHPQHKATRAVTGAVRDKTRWTRCVSRCPPVVGQPVGRPDGVVGLAIAAQKPEWLEVAPEALPDVVLRTDFAVVDAACYYRPSEFFEDDDDGEGALEVDPKGHRSSEGGP